jgi:hypothetical protein
VAGGGSADFGVFQNDSSPRLSHVRYANDGNYGNTDYESYVYPGKWSGRIFIGGSLDPDVV